MHQHLKILNAKLLQPRITNIIHRKRLYPVLSEISRKCLTLVTAGAGFGKTTLISDACAYLGLDTVWYRLDGSDRDYITFLSYLVAGIQAYYPRFGVETIRCMNDANISDQSGQAAILTHFLREIEEHVKKDMIIVLDDYQRLQGSVKINHSLQFFLEHLPQNVHLVIISRTIPGLNLSRFRSQRNILDITEKHISFDISETTELYSGCLHLPLADENIQMLHNKTHGWAAGLILIYNSLSGKDSGEMNRFLSALKGTHREISNYLGENVFDLQSEEKKQFLIKTSILSRMSPGFCDQLLKINNSHAILANLEENHLFTFSYDEHREWYYYHHLFQDFLRTKIRQAMDEKTFRRLNIQAARLWEKQDDHGESLRHYIMAEAFKPACKVLGKVGKRYIEQGRIQLINAYIDAVPAHYLEKHPWVQYAKARALERSGHLITAIQEYEKAHKVFKAHNDPKNAGLCLFVLGSLYYQIGDFTQSEKRLTQLLSQSLDDPRLRMDILGSLIFITSHQGRMHIADKYIDEGQSILSKINSPRHLAWFYFCRGFRYSFAGDFTKALQFGKQTREICNNFKLYHLLAFNYHLISWSSYYLGLFSEGMEDAEKGLALIKERGYQDHSRAWILADYALNAAGLGKTQEAFYAGEQSLNIFRNQESIWGQVWAYHVLHDVSLKSGDERKAEENVRSGLDLLKGTYLPLHESILKIRLAKCLLERNQKEEVPDLLDDAKHKFKQSTLFVAMADLLFARFYWDQQQKKQAMQYLISGLRICETMKYDTWVIAEKEWITPLLVACFSQGRMKTYITTLFQQKEGFGREVLSQIGKKRSPEIRKAAAELVGNLKKGPPPDIKVYCLGKFRILQKGIEIPEKKWKSKKAKALFKYLVCKREHGYVEKDVLMELLWPGENPDKITGRLHDALSSLRKTLEPDLLRGVPSSYLLRQGTGYRLYLGEGGSVDTAYFLSEVAQAKQEEDPDRRLSHFIKAESCYKGDFLEEDLYVEWCMTHRQHLKEDYLLVLEKIRHHYETHHNYAKCVEYADKYLKHNPYAEHIYQQLMRYHMLSGNKNMVTRTFKRCQENMEKGYDAPVSRETEVMYEKFLHQLTN